MILILYLVCAGEPECQSFLQSPALRPSGAAEAQVN